MKKTNLMIVYFLELMLVLVLCMMCYFGNLHDDYGLILTGFLAYLPMSIFILIILLLIGESFISKKIPLFRFIYIGFTIVLAIMMYMDDGGLPFFNVTLWFLSIPLAIIQVIVIIKNGFLSKEDNLNTNRTLPVGIFSKRHFILIIMAVLILVGLILAATALINTVSWPPFVLYLIAIILGIALLIVVSYKGSPITAVLHEINQNLSYAEFKKKADLLKQNRLHPETINYLNLILANYTFVINKEEAFGYFEISFEPTYKPYVQWYKPIRILYFIHKEKYEEANKYIIDFNKNKRNIPLSLNLERLIIINNTSEEIDNIESLYPLNNKLIFSSVVNCQILMKYFYSRCNNEKALEYANKLLSYNSDFTEYNNLALEIISNINQKEIKE